MQSLPLHALPQRIVGNATKNALKLVKKRIGSKTGGGFLFVDRPIFDVNVELHIPQYSMSPPLEEVQSAINRSCRAILAVAKSLPVWATKADKKEYLQEDLDLFGWSLTDAEMAEADAATTPAGTPSFMCSS